MFPCLESSFVVPVGLPRLGFIYHSETAHSTNSFILSPYGMPASFAHCFNAEQGSHPISINQIALLRILSQLTEDLLFFSVIGDSIILIFIFSVFRLTSGFGPVRLKRGCFRWFKSTQILFCVYKKNEVGAFFLRSEKVIVGLTMIGFDDSSVFVADEAGS